MKLFKVTGCFIKRGKVINKCIYIAGESRTDVNYQINKYGIIAIKKIEEVHHYANQ